MTDKTEYPDEKFGDFVQRTARNYNDVGDIPRDEMWAAIGVAREKARRGTAIRRRTIWTVAGMAATLAIGVALGRYARTPAAGDVAGNRASTQSPAVYDVAAMEHLSRAEALLTSFQTPATGVYADSMITRWSRDLLSNTRLLLDSPAAKDPARRKLLQDLERILVQMLQKSPAESDAAARAFVERSLTRTDMLTRLRTMQAAAFNSGS